MAGPTTPTNRVNVTDREQSVIEAAEFEGGSPHFAHGETRVVAKQNRGGASKTHNAGTELYSNAGVVFPHDDAPARFVENQIGKA